MPNRLRRHLELFSDPTLSASLRGIRFGLEREALRVDELGLPAKTPHPATLGSALTHPHITTDFSEAMLELITEPFESPETTLRQLQELLAVSCTALVPDEVLWGASMPCCPAEEHDIALADYGSSSSGRMKRLYRSGLSHRYGRSRQIIAGLHFNFSLSEAFWKRYHQLVGRRESLRELGDSTWFHTLRNCHRWGWLLAYLFGASPVVPPSFPRPHGAGLRRLSCGDYSSPGATSLRLSRVGYYSAAQRRHLLTRMDNVDSYAHSLRSAIIEPFPDYAAIDQSPAGEPQQLNTGLLQVENEYYGPARPKRTAIPGTPPLCTLAQDGVEYLELRCLDLNPRSALGIDNDQILFLSTFLLYCLAADGSRHSMRRNQRNMERTAHSGRRRGLLLEDGTRQHNLRDWGVQVIDGISTVAQQLDAAHGGDHHQRSCERQRRKLVAPEHTPAAQLLQDMEESGESFQALIYARSVRQRNELSTILTPRKQQHYQALAQHSQRRQQDLERAPHSKDFKAYLHNYFDQYRQLPATPAP